MLVQVPALSCQRVQHLFKAGGRGLSAQSNVQHPPAPPSHLQTLHLPSKVTLDRLVSDDQRSSQFRRLRAVLSLVPRPSRSFLDQPQQQGSAPQLESFVGPSPSPPSADQSTCTTSFVPSQLEHQHILLDSNPLPTVLSENQTSIRTSIDIQTSTTHRRNRLGSKRHLVNLNGPALAHACLICSLPRSNPANNL